MTARAADPFPIIDTHIHLFDPTRPQGVPWPPKTNALIYKPTYPDRYRKLVAKHNVVGAIEVECSPWLEDNQWVLDVIEKDTIMVGTIGNLEPGKPDYRKQLERFHRNKLFLGIRYGYLWGRDVEAESRKPEFLAGLKDLADAGLTLDTANPRPELFAALLRITDAVPKLRIVIDHLPTMAPPADPAPLREVGKRRQVWVKVSGVLRDQGGRIPLDAASYRDRLDLIYDVFGPDRVLYGSDWPNSEPRGSYDQVIGVVREYFLAKGREVAEKYFWRNSVAAYRWVRRQESQPRPA
jgi:predicted TIM-barrel fold metal-dependent hydrolase